MRKEQSITPHQDQVDLQHPFDVAVEWLERKAEARATTSRATEFIAEAAVAQRGAHRRESMILFSQRGREYERVYSCC